MSMYAVVDHNPAGEFTTGTVLGVKEADTPAEAVEMVADDAIDDRLAEQLGDLGSKVDLLKTILEAAAEEHSNKKVVTIVAWEIAAEYPQRNLGLSDQ